MTTNIVMGKIPESLKDYYKGRAIESAKAKVKATSELTDQVEEQYYSTYDAALNAVREWCWENNHLYSFDIHNDYRKVNVKMNDGTLQGKIVIRIEVISTK